MLRQISIVLAVLFGCALAQWEPNFQPGRAGIVHLFEWNWDTIADECEQLLGPAMFAGVQVSWWRPSHVNAGTALSW